MFQFYMGDHTRVIFEGVAKSVGLPGAEGDFEILDFHRPIIALLKTGSVNVDGVNFPIYKGIAKFYDQKLMVLVEV